MQPSESIRSKVARVAARSAASASAGSTTASVVRTHEHGRQRRGEHPGALGHAADATTRRGGDVPVFGTVSVVMIAVAASGRRAGSRAAAATSTPASSRSMGSRSPMRPVEHTTTSPGETPSGRGDVLGRAVRVQEALGAGADVGAAGVEDDGVHDAVAAPPDATRRPGGRRPGWW